MFKKLVCLLWGHKYETKSPNGVVEQSGVIVHAYRVEKSKYCPRCGLTFI